MAAKDQKGRGLDIFKLLSTGTKFDKKRFSKHVNVFRSGRDEREDGHVTVGEPNSNEKALNPAQHDVDQKDSGDGPKTKRKRIHQGLDESSHRERSSNQEVQIFRKSKHIKVSGGDVPDPIRNFQDLVIQLGTQQALVDSLVSEGFDQPSPIQMQAIPVLADRRDVVAIAPTGSGKTLAFLLPILVSLDTTVQSGEGMGIRAIVVSPTKELAGQTARVARSLLVNRNAQLNVALLGKVGVDEAMKADVVLATPLKLAHLVDTKAISLDRVEYLILDEADRLFMTEKPDKNEKNAIAVEPMDSNDGQEADGNKVTSSDTSAQKAAAKQTKHFLNQIDTILNACSNPRLVRGLFSATFPAHVESLARNVLQDPVTVRIGRLNSPVDTVKQHLVFVGSERGKLLGLSQLIRSGVKPPILVFVDTKDRVKSLRKELVHEGVKVDCIHADQAPILRQAALDNFRRGSVHVLVATDVLGRGIDFLGVRAVVNFDFPRSSMDYIHRIGRTGRAGRSGEAYTLYTEKDASHLKPIANLVKESGGQVPDWILKLKREKWRSKVSYGKVGEAPKADQISTSRRAHKAQKTKEKNMRKKAKANKPEQVL